MQHNVELFSTTEIKLLFASTLHAFLQSFGRGLLCSTGNLTDLCMTNRVASFFVAYSVWNISYTKLSKNRYHAYTHTFHFVKCKHKYIL